MVYYLSHLQTLVLKNNLLTNKYIAYVNTPGPDFSTEFIRHGGTVQVLQKLLGHAKITTTMKYIHVDEQMMTQAIEALDAKQVA